MVNFINFIGKQRSRYDQLTTQAAQHIKDFLENRGSGVGIRVGVRTAGCSGLAHVLEFVDDPNNSDERF